jgi:hypothetical protein
MLAMKAGGDSRTAEPSRAGRQFGILAISKPLWLPELWNENTSVIPQDARAP